MKTIALLLATVLALNTNGFALQTNPPPPASQSQTNGAKQAAKAKAEVQKRGVGEQSRVEVSLRNGTKVKGYISKIEDNSFEVTDRKSGKVTTIGYSEVAKVKGPGLSEGAKTALWIGVAAGAVLGILAAVFLPRRE